MVEERDLNGDDNNIGVWEFALGGVISSRLIINKGGSHDLAGDYMNRSKLLVFRVTVRIPWFGYTHLIFVSACNVFTFHNICIIVCLFFR